MTRDSACALVRAVVAARAREDSQVASARRFSAATRYVAELRAELRADARAYHRDRRRSAHPRGAVQFDHAKCDAFDRRCTNLLLLRLANLRHSCLPPPSLQRSSRTCGRASGRASGLASGNANFLAVAREHAAAAHSAASHSLRALLSQNIVRTNGGRRYRDDGNDGSGDVTMAAVAKLAFLCARRSRSAPQAGAWPPPPVCARARARRCRR